jgi:hypothetical protein
MASVPKPNFEPNNFDTPLFKPNGAKVGVRNPKRLRRRRFSVRRIAKPGVLLAKRRALLDEPQPGVLYGHPKGEAHLWMWL